MPSAPGGDQPLLSRNETRIRFLIAGGINFLATNTTLQLLLLIHAIPTFLATGVSQIINGALGFFLYGTHVFQGPARDDPTSIRRRKGTLYRFATLSCLLLVTNTMGINLIAGMGFSRNLGAMVMIPVLTASSYWAQKHWVFLGRG